jgi:hypothetical protein
MNRVLLLILVAGATFLIVLFAVKPELIGDIWLWVVGLAGVIVKAFQALVNYFKKLFSGDGDKKPAEAVKPETVINEAAGDVAVSSENQSYNGVTLRLLRYSDDGSTTIGLLTINGQYYCYTLEDTFHKVKVPGETRIPAGRYWIKFRKEETQSTLTMRQRYPEWFTWHLELQQVPGFTNIYIHNGGTHNDTEGCILVSDSLNVSNTSTFLSNSRKTFEKLYRYLSEQLHNDVPVQIIIYDENWLKNIN